MNENPPSSTLLPRWFAVAIAAILALQLTMNWIHGALLNRQHQDLVALREDIQDLTESLEANASTESNQESEALVPLHSRSRSRHHRLQRVAFTRLQEETPKKPQEDTPQQDPAAKELEDARKSAREAVEKARDTQSKLSIEENYRKAEEKKKLQSAEDTWMKWAGAGLVITFLALVIRAWLRRRG